MNELKEFFDASPDAVIVMDEEGRVERWNGKAETLFGWTAEEMKGQLLSESIIPQRYRKAHQEGIAKFLKTREGPVLNKTIEMQALNKSNLEFDVSLNISAALVNGKYQFIGFVRDITARRKAEEKFRNLLESAPDAIVIVDKQGIIKLVNAQTEILFGYKREELLEHRLEMLIPERYKKTHPEHRQSFFESPKARGMGLGMGLFGKKKNGEEFPVEISLSPLETEEGLLVSAAIRDTTERKRAEEKFRNLLESAPDAIVIVNEEGVIQLVNAQTEKLFGYSKNEILDQKVELLMPSRFGNSHEGRRTVYFKSPKVRQMGEGFELFGRKKDGTEFPVEISLSPLETEEGLLVSAAIRDISEKKKLEMQIREANINLEKKVQDRTMELENKNRELEQFAYVASHDLQEPLRTTSSFIELFREKYAGQLDEETDTMLNYITQANDRMKVLIKDLLDYSRIGRKTVMEEVDCNQVLEDVLADLSVSIQETGTVIKAEMLPVISGYPTELKQLFQNLVSNSIKFRKPGMQPVIRVSAEQKKDCWQFAVADNGIGIEEEFRERIFIIFQRLHTRSEYEGSGIGLSHCKKIAELHGGKIWVDSRPGKGSIFYFTIQET
jgi:PAS domain S-box-containing protein